MSKGDREYLKSAVVQYLWDNKSQFLWETLSIAKPFLDHAGHYPQTEDAGYRRVLSVCRELEDEGILGSGTTTMNGRLWYLKSRVDRDCASVDDIPF